MKFSDLMFATLAVCNIIMLFLMGRRDEPDVDQNNDENGASTIGPELEVHTINDIQYLEESMKRLVEDLKRSNHLNQDFEFLTKAERALAVEKMIDDFIGDAFQSQSAVKGGERDDH